MKTYSTTPYCVGLISAVLALADTALAANQRVHVPAGALDDAVEALARQAGAIVMYPGGLLDGRSTAGVAGMLTVRDAFAKLLDGTSLWVAEDAGAFLITAMGASEPDANVTSTAAPSPVASPPAVLASEAAPSSAGTAVWMEHELRLPCAACDWTREMRQILEHLGATVIAVHPRSAMLRSLTPAGTGNGQTATEPNTQTHWRPVTLDVARLTPRELSPAGRAAWADNLRTHILPLFVTRNVRESGHRLVLDVLVAAEPSAAVECRQVVKPEGRQRLCGSAEQWRTMQAHTGYLCRKISADVRTGSRIGRSGSDHVCASVDAWKRADFALSNSNSIVREGAALR